VLAAHDDLTYLVGDFAAAAAADPDRDQLEDLYVAALAESAHAARWSQRVGWTAGTTTRSPPGSSRWCWARR
jgi:hypothetical protein